MKCGSWTRLNSSAFFKKHELEPAIIWKVATCQQITYKSTRTQWVVIWPAIRSGDTGQQIYCFGGSCQLIKTWMYNIKLQAPKLTRKSEIKHWYTCGANRWKVRRSLYRHVIAKFSRMIGFLSYVASLKIQNWDRDQITENFKKYVTSIGREMSPWYRQVMIVRGCLSLTALN